MLTDKVKAQDFASRILKTHFEKGRLAHTYLLTGKKESGKEDLAMAFAQGLNCEKGAMFLDCGCAACRKTENRTHPDVKWLGDDEKARSIKIEEVRDAVALASFKPYEGKWKVFILMDADRLTVDAQNALLKTLEEPPAQTVFVFLVESKSHLLETIQSRSFEVRLKPRDFSDSLESGFIAGLWRENWEDILDVFQNQSREDLKNSFDLLMNNLRNELRMSEMSDRNIPAGKIVEAISVICETKDAVDANANQKLALTRLSIKLRNLLPLRK